MKSTLKIDFVDNGKGLEPVIKAEVIYTEDVRDGLIKTFFQNLGCYSSWLRVDRYQNAESQTVIISPVMDGELLSMIDKIKGRLDGGTDVSSGENSPFIKIPSRYQIADKVLYTTPSARQFAPENPSYFSGKVTAITFTEGKVLYDILDIDGQLFPRIVSDDVTQVKEE